MYKEKNSNKNNRKTEKYIRDWIQPTRHHALVEVALLGLSFGKTITKCVLYKAFAGFKLYRSNTTSISE